MRSSPSTRMLAAWLLMPVALLTCPGGRTGATTAATASQASRAPGFGEKREAQSPVLSGQVTGLQGAGTATIKALGPRTYQLRTGPDGTWAVQNVYPGRYRITATNPKYRITPSYRQVDVSNRHVSGIDFVADPLATLGSAGQQFDVGGRVAGLEQGDAATIRAVGPESSSANTRPDGTWTIHSLRPGSYEVRASHPQYDFLPQFRHVVVAARDIQNVNFQARSKTGYRMTGTVSGLRAPHRATVRLTGPKNTHAETGAGGRWTVPGLPAGAYEVRPEHAQYDFSPLSQQKTIVNRDLSGVNFHARLKSGSPRD